MFVRNTLKWNFYIVFICTHLIYTSKIELLQLTCNKDESCYGTSICRRKNLVNEIRPESLSKETCFDTKKITFKMGTDRPLIKNDGESPSKLVELDSFCIDQTEVSNRQFFQYVAETNYKTEVILFKKSSNNGL